MPTLHVLEHSIELTEDAATPLIAADILYWDTDGGEDGEVPDHLHINPELPGFGEMERLLLATIGVQHPDYPACSA